MISKLMSQDEDLHMHRQLIVALKARTSTFPKHFLKAFGMFTTKWCCF